MNFKIKSLQQAMDSDVQQNNLLNKYFSEEGQENVYHTELFGTIYKAEIEIIYDECPIVFNFLCGSKAGIQLEMSQHNANILEAYPGILDNIDISDTLSEEFPNMLSHELYELNAEKAANYLNRKDTADFIVRNMGTGVYMVNEKEEFTINLSRKDIEFYASLEDDFQYARLT